MTASRWLTTRRCAAAPTPADAAPNRAGRWRTRMRDRCRGLERTELERLVPSGESGYTTSIVSRLRSSPLVRLAAAAAGLVIALTLDGCAGPAVSPTDQTLLR